MGWDDDPEGDAVRRKRWTQSMRYYNRLFCRVPAGSGQKRRPVLIVIQGRGVAVGY